MSVSAAAAQTAPAAVSDFGIIKRRMALVIGNAAYKRQPLVNPIHDAQDMKAALERVGFTVTYGADLSYQKMESQIADFTKSLRNGDIALFYYSGHGAYHTKKGHLLTFNKGDLARATLLAAMQKQKPRLTVVLTDCCAIYDDIANPKLNPVTLKPPIS